MERFDGQLTDIYRQLNKTRDNNISNYLSQVDVDQFYRNNRLIQKIINLKPDDANKDLPVWQMSKGDKEKLKVAWLSIESIGQPLEELNIQSLFAKAGQYANLYGDAFIFLGIDDGQDSTEPVNLDKIKAVKWAAVKHRYEVSLDYKNESYAIAYDSLTPNEKIQSQTVFHKSRVLRISGNKLHGFQLDFNGGYNDSLIQSVYNEFLDYKQTVLSNKDMVNSHSVFKYQLKGLKDLGTKHSAATLRNRFESILEGLNTIGGLFFDKDTEDAEFISKAYGGVSDITKVIQEWFIAAADMPRGKLFGNAAIGAMSEAGESERRAWNEAIEAYQRSRLYQPQLKLTKYLLLALGEDPDNCDITYASFYPLTEKEQAEIQKINADTDQIYINTGVLTPEIVANSRFGGSEYGMTITLENGWIEPKKVEESNSKGI